MMTLDIMREPLGPHVHSIGQRATSHGDVVLNHHRLHFYFSPTAAGTSTRDRRDDKSGARFLATFSNPAKRVSQLEGLEVPGSQVQSDCTSRYRRAPLLVDELRGVRTRVLGVSWICPESDVDEGKWLPLMGVTIVVVVVPCLSRRERRKKYGGGEERRRADSWKHGQVLTAKR